MRRVLQNVCHIARRTQIRTGAIRTGAGSAGELGPTPMLSPVINEPCIISVIGAPVNLGQPKLGVEGGPDSLRAAGLCDSIANQWHVEDLGDVGGGILPQGGARERARYSKAVGEANRQIAEKVYGAASAGKFPLTLGGDHSIAIGTVSGVLRARPNVGLIWVDAHADLHTVSSSPSGNIHGMPVAFLMGLQDWAEVPGFEWGVGGEYPRINAEDVVYIGLRDLEREERERIKQLKIKAFTMQQVDRYGIGKVMEMTLDHLLSKSPNRPLHLSYDIDATDPVYVAATGTAVHGGLTFREAHYVAEAVAESGQLGSMDLVEVNPRLADPKKAQDTITLGKHLILSALGQTIC